MGTPSPEPRLELLDAAYDLPAAFESQDPKLPPALFGVVIDRNFHPEESQVQREQFAYEVLLNKFGVMLKRRARDGRPNRGLVIHDRRVVAERDIQSWTSEWRKSAGDIGQLMNLADVPLFADSRATRLLQVADLVSYSLFRRYAPGGEREKSFGMLWRRFHAEDGHVHGLVHYTPSFGQASCECEASRGRLLDEGQARFLEPTNRRQSSRQRERRRGGRPVDQ